MDFATGARHGDPVSRWSRRTARQMRAALAASAITAIALALGAVTPAGGHNLNSKLRAEQAQLGKVHRRGEVLTSTLSHYGDQISQLESQVASLRNEEAAVKQQLALKQAELDRAVSELSRARAHLVVVRGHLERALGGLRHQLVAIYESAPPDALTVILNSEGWSDLVSRTTYLQEIQGQTNALVGRVRDLRNQARATVNRLQAAKNQIQTARDAIAGHKAQLGQARSTLQSRQAHLEAARAKREGALQQIKEQAQGIAENVEGLQSKIRDQIQAQSSSVALPAGPLPGASNTGLIWPVQGPITTCFCMRWGQMHPGVDIAAPSGTPIHAAAAGTVFLLQPEAISGGYGNFTCLDHAGDLSTCYAHQTSFAVSSGQSVSQGQVIGYVGSTGFSTGPHLHFEVRVNGTAVDPMGYL